MATLALLAAFTAAATTTSSLGVSARITNLMLAEDLAESAVQQAMAQLQEEFLWRGDVVLEDLPGFPTGARAVLTFDRDAGVPYSTNNYEGLESDGYQREIPSQHVHLIATAVCGGAERTVEMVVHFPEYPVTMACDGRVHVSNSLVATLPNAQDLNYDSDDGFYAEPDDLEPGDLVSNSRDPDALVLDENTHVTGDLQSRGGVAISDSRVEGEVRSHWSRPAPIPDLEVDDFDPGENDNTHYEELAADRYSNLNLVGNVRIEGNLLVTDTLDLDNAFLFVDGNLTVEGPLRGTGAVVVSGNASVHGGARLEANEQIAILTGGNAELLGEGQAQSLFKGLVYSRGSFTARELTVVGGFIVDEGSPTRIQDANVFFNGSVVAPRIRTQVWAAVRRFSVPPRIILDGEELQRDPFLQFPAGAYARGILPGNPVPRHPANVLDQNHPEYRRSNWDMDDPATFSIRWEGDRPVYTYSFWGRPDTPPRPVWTFNSRQEAVEYVARMNTAQNVHDHLNGTPPRYEDLVVYYDRVLEHLEESQGSVDHPYNVTFSPNQFLDPGDRIRVKLRRVY